MTAKNSILAATTALPLIASVAYAKGKCEFGLNGGVGIPTGDFGSSDTTSGLDAKTGPTIGAIFFYFVTDKVAIGVDGTWNKNKHAAEGTVENLGGGATLTANKDKFKGWHLGAHGKFMIPTEGKVSPYGLLGVGVYHLAEDYEYTLDDGACGITKFTDEGDQVVQPGSRLGGRIGVGTMIDTSPQIGVALEGDYNLIKMDKDKFGVSSLKYITVRGGLYYKFTPK